MRLWEWKIEKEILSIGSRKVELFDKYDTRQNDI